jgi:hypothetical protein
MCKNFLGGNYSTTARFAGLSLPFYSNLRMDESFSPVAAHEIKDTISHGTCMENA